MHARSVDSGPHPSRTWVRALAGGLEIPAGMRVCGENLFARHSIGYDDLASYFLVFNVWQDDWCLGWDETVEWASLLGLETVPVLYRGEFPGVAALVKRWNELGRTSEGFVVRSVIGFERSGFATHVAKWVRAGHVTTDEHWMNGAVVPNGRRSSGSR